MRWPPPFPAGRTMQRFQVTATDTAWTAGHGPQTQDPISAILLLSAGRRAALPQRAGDGAAELTAAFVAEQRAQNRIIGMRACALPRPLRSRAYSAIGAMKGTAVAPRQKKRVLATATAARLSFPEARQPGSIS
jgi:hypothetical protein